MKIASVDLARTSRYLAFRSDLPFVRICGRWFHGAFELPEDVKAVTFVVHDRPAADRYAFSLACRACVTSHERGCDIFCFDEFTDWLEDQGLKPGKIYYAEVWY